MIEPAEPTICLHCGGSRDVRNPMGYCDHLYYPQCCDICEKSEKKITTDDGSIPEPIFISNFKDRVHKWEQAEMSPIESVPSNLIAAYAQALLACRAALKALRKCNCMDYDFAEIGADAIIELEHALDMAKGETK